MDVSIFSKLDFLDYISIAFFLLFAIGVVYCIYVVTTGNTLAFYRFNNLAKREQENLDLEQQIIQKEAEIKALENRFEEISQRIKDKETISGIVDELEKSVVEKSQELESTMKLLGQAQADIEKSNSLKGLIEKIKEDQVDILDEKIAQKQEQLTELNNQVDRCNSEAAFTKFFDSFDDKLNQSVDKAKLEFEIDGLKNKIHEKNKLLEDLTRQSKQYNSEVATAKIVYSLEKQFDKVLQKNAIQEEIRKLDNILGEKQAEVQRLNNTNRELNSNKGFEQLTTIPNDIKMYNSTIQNKRAFLGTETEALELFQKYLKSKGLYYSDRTIYAFHTSLKVQRVNPISILAGLSGTGKTQLSIQYGEFFNFFSEHVSVQPRWDSKDDLLGFYNYLEKTFQPTKLLKDLYHFDKKVGNSPYGMLMIILDEMNLARVEYYFSEFLSKLELRNKENLDQNSQNSQINIGTESQPFRINVGSNVVFVGTMNDDESTFSLSDKVLDRSNVIHFGAPSKFEDNIYKKEQINPIFVDAKTFNHWIKPFNSKVLDQEIILSINKLNDALKKVGKAFGYRVESAIKDYIAQYPGDDINKALADQIEMKIIPKLISLEQSDNTDQCLREIMDIIDKTEDHKLFEAFNQSFTEYQITGMFLWRGVQRK